jgi:hypothetical protein
MGTVKEPDRLAELGRQIAAHQEQESWLPSQIDAARTRFLDEPQLRSRPTSHRALGLGLAFAAILPLLWLGGRRWGGGEKPATFEVGSSRTETSGSWLAAPADQDLPVRFAGGATVLLSPQTRARVVEVTENGARVELWQGQIAVSVPHKAETNWVFLAGPFDVKVTGTRFDLGWDEARHTFQLAMSDGSVSVGGPGIIGRRTVVAGQKVTWPLPSPPASASLAASAPGPDPAVPGPDPAAPGLPAGPGSHDPGGAAGAGNEPTGAGSSPRGAVGRSTWRELAVAGRFAGSLEAADRAGFDGLLASLGAEDLLLLGDTARLAGSGERARRVYTTTRQRFAGSAGAARAAFELGRMEASGPSGGVPWFRLYLAESPGGPLAREAMGRMLEAFLRQHDTASATPLARSYLQLYPGGPHAKLARSVTGE